MSEFALGQICNLLSVISGFCFATEKWIAGIIFAVCSFAIIFLH